MCQIIVKKTNMEYKKNVGMTKNLLIALFVCVVATSFQTGYNNGIVNAPGKVIKQFIKHTIERRTGSDVTDAALSTFYGIMVAIFSAGAIAGSMLSGVLANRFGRKRAIVLGSLVTVVGLGLQMSSKYSCSYELLIIGRFLTGVNTGIMSVAVPLFSSEIAPVRMRGLCVILNQFSNSIGSVLSLVLGNKNVLGTESMWQFAIGINLVPVIFMLCTFYWIPESPRYLMLTKKRKGEALEALKWFRGGADVVHEFLEVAAEGEEKKPTVCTILRTSTLRRPLVISLMVVLSRQLSGMHVMIYYSTIIFMSTGLSEDLAQYASLGTALVTLPMILVSSIVVDRAGRRPLLLSGLAGMLLFSVSLSAGLILQVQFKGLSYLCVVSVFMMTVFYSIGPAGIPKLLATELFTQGPRATAVSLSVTVSRTSNLIVALTFPILHTTLGRFSFLPFVGFLVFFLAYIFWKLPETKGKTCMQISELFDLPSSSDRQADGVLNTCTLTRVTLLEI